ncbi:MAG: hypothetical protein Q8Q07_05730 [Dehalococcoidales bacterium]|nr:hypothetical protein [Dehalococcoidales bacterium]
MAHLVADGLDVVMDNLVRVVVNVLDGVNMQSVTERGRIWWGALRRAGAGGKADGDE